MGAWKELLTTDVGLASLGVIVVVIAMGVGFSLWFRKQIALEEARRRG